MIRKVKMERFTVISASPFDEVVAAIKTSIGNPNIAEFVKPMQEAESAAELDGSWPAEVSRVTRSHGVQVFLDSIGDLESKIFPVTKSLRAMDHLRHSNRQPQRAIRRGDRAND